MMVDAGFSLRRPWRRVPPGRPRTVALLGARSYIMHDAPFCARRSQLCPDLVQLCFVCVVTPLSGYVFTRL